MVSVEAVSLRLRYEAFSKYAAGISKCKDTDALAHMLVKHVKYLMPFNFGRVVVFKSDYFHEIRYDKHKTLITVGTGLVLKGLERLALTTMIPKLVTKQEIPFELIADIFEGFDINENDYEELALVPLSNKTVYTAFFGFASRPKLRISQIDNQFAKLMLDLYLTKFSEIKLSLDAQLQSAVIESNLQLISAKNAEIERVLVNQEQLIKERTAQLQARNTALEEYSWITSHEIRRPLANILGLLQLAQADMNDLDNLRDVINLLTSSAYELDEEIKRANILLNKDLTGGFIAEA
ncbi:hypothetical protein BCY91_07435 [Pelobium manganitolerans]|uniref:histidine kinase n=1 Tax=Pelobium manganitolerans TaxID=1842495 RepID=A0A419S3U4_9SPHI|nr:hypothetical protein [Pelobium manganitolerans]RKD14311.1 hypothetical protein BCY91_07435 [Pelobium manganitolerans]